jgi:PLP dependent protein
MFFRKPAFLYYFCSYFARGRYSAFAAFTRSLNTRRLPRSLYNIPASDRSCSNTASSRNKQQVVRSGLSFITPFGSSTSILPHIRKSSTNDMDIDLDVAANYRAVQDRVERAATTATNGERYVRLVAVSKTKPVELLEAAYDAGCRCFGENYVQELESKAELWKDRTDVQWHFIGALQSNKCQALVNCCANINQLTVETISSVKLATKLNNAVTGKVTDNKEPQRLKVFVQVNTSGEESKSGIEPGAPCVELCRFITTECPALELRGLMTIGAPGDASCFNTLVQCRDEVLARLQADRTGPVPELELSMGMSDDFEQAIAAGATNVRVGSTIFGHRDYSPKT